jgi:hypothetical protein
VPSLGELQAGLHRPVGTGAKDIRSSAIACECTPQVSRRGSREDARLEVALPALPVRAHVIPEGPGQELGNSHLSVSCSFPSPDRTRHRAVSGSRIAPQVRPTQRERQQVAKALSVATWPSNRDRRA